MVFPNNRGISRYAFGSTLSTFEKVEQNDIEGVVLVFPNNRGISRYAFGSTFLKVDKVDVEKDINILSVVSNTT